MTAIISPCGLYRYRLERTVAMTGPVYAFFGINPSTADASIDDATVRKWIGFTKRWGGSRLIVGNVSPFRAKDVKRVGTTPWTLEVDLENSRYIMAMCQEADFLVPCWGDRKKVPRRLHQDIDALLSLLLASGKPVMHLGLTKGGDPKHPLMLGYDTPLTPWGDAQ